MAEVHAHRVDPEMIGKLRVAHGDVPGTAHVETVAGEQAEGTGQALLAQQAFGLDRGLLGGSCQRNTVWPSRGSE
ncbi:hypothetical protein PSm6_51820 [Pseudomonas solani]|uniref:Uncharacterized protein n=1 Tax=Pseudomonas solani TaxID=2731552 RepID=A0ABN6BYA0_9PSED|nr:hypothetical protein PSm6_51820 [Pseudomonas solani]